MASKKQQPFVIQKAKAAYTVDVLLSFAIILALTVHSSYEFSLSCSDVTSPSLRCFCESRSDYSSYGLELLCPNAFVEVHNITLVANVLKQQKPKPSSSSSSQNNNSPVINLNVKCNAYEPQTELQWQLLQGFNMSSAGASSLQNNPKYNLRISSCHVQSADTLHNLLNTISVKHDSIIGFSYELTRNALPPNQDALFTFISSLTALESLGLRKVPGLNQIPPLQTLTHLEQLHLRENSISSINVDTFNANGALNLIDLSFNQLEELPTAGGGAFLFPASLILLDLNTNRLRALSQESFQGLTSLRTLSIRQNPNLTSIEPETFSHLSSLQVLDLDFTKFKEFPNLSALNALQEIRISFLDNNPSIFTNHSLSNYTAYGDFKASSELSLVFTADYSTVFNSHFPNLTKVSLISDGLLRVPILNGSAMPKLTVLNLSANQIRVVDENIFSSLLTLRELDLSLNQIIQFNGINARELNKLNLQYNFIQHLDSSVWNGVKNLQVLKLGHNQIDSIDSRAFEPLSNLLEIDLSHNQLESLSASPHNSHSAFLSSSTTESAEETSTAHQETMGIFFEAGFDQSVLRFCRKLHSINLSHNKHIEMIYDDWKLLFMNLSTLDLSYNALSHLHPTDLNFITPRALTLDLGFNNITTVNMDYAAIYLEKDENAKQTVNIKLVGNPLNCDCQLFAFYSFALHGINFIDKPKLTCENPASLHGKLFATVSEASLTCAYEGDAAGCPPECNCWKIPANKTILVDCSNRRLHFIPSLHGIKAPNSYRIVLNLAGNGLRAINFNSTQNISSNVVEIDISSNELNSIAFLNLFHADDQDTNLIEDSAKNQTSSSSSTANANNPRQVIVFNLAQNNFACDDCELHRLLKRYFKQISDYKELTCHLNINNNTATDSDQIILSSLPIEAVNEHDYCGSTTTMSAALNLALMLLAIFAGILFALFGVLVVLYMKHGWAIRAFLYSKGFGCFFFPDDDEDEKVYDAFVSYSHKDEPWVISQLVSRLEEEEGFKLCLHYRDWTPGDWIPDQIVHSVDKSRRTLIILSKNFVESIWSRLEFKAAHNQALNERTNRLIVILIGDDLTDDDINDEDLRMYMKMNTYLKWTDPWLWHKLKFALPHKRKAGIGTRQELTNQQLHQQAIQLDKLRQKIEQTDNIDDIKHKANGKVIPV